MVIESNVSTLPTNPNEYGYKEAVMFPEKLAAAKEFIVRNGFPKEIEERRSKRIQDEGVWVKGLLCGADAPSSTILLNVNVVDHSPQYYTIKIWDEEIYTQLVKKYWNNVFKVHIMPQNKDDKDTIYDFIEQPKRNGYDEETLFSEKSLEANEAIVHYNRSNELEETRQKRIEEHSFWVKGYFCQADASTRIFSLYVKATNSFPQQYYTINAGKSETLAELVKDYWNEEVEIRILLQTQKANEKFYNFIEVR